MCKALILKTLNHVYMNHSMINKCLFPLSLCMMLVNADAFAQTSGINSIEWKKIATLPATDGSPSIGFAGAINAVYSESLIVAGGANFPDKMPWDGGKKHYSDEIKVL